MEKKNYKVFNSSNEDVKKFVFEWEGVKPAVAEAVLYKYGNYEERTVICCSVQSGCPVKCSFCGTGGFFRRNLTSREIVEQVVSVLDEVGMLQNTKSIKKFQIMFMSMGEPFLNYDNLELAICSLHCLFDNAQLLVSTSAPTAILKNIMNFTELSRRIDKVGLQFSVHESTDENRKKLIPTPTCTLRQIAVLGEFWSAFVGRKPYYNYCVHEGNNEYVDAVRLCQTFRTDVWETTLSVICEKDESVKASIDRQLSIIDQFAKYMVEHGASLRVFNPAGQDDIGGGCGQLWYYQKWLNSHKE